MAHTVAERDQVDLDDVGRQGLLNRARRLRLAADALERRALQPGRQTEWSDVLHGDWTLLRSGSRSVLQRSRASSEHRADAFATIALTSALLGETEAARSAASRATVEPDRDDGSALGLVMAHAVARLVEGDPHAAADQMFEALRGREEDAGASSAGVGGLVAEVAARAGRHHEARPLLTQWSSGRPRPDGSAGEELMLGRALVAEDCRAALSALVDSRMLTSSFASSRAHLWLGMSHRRQGHRLRAREHLHVAHDLLSALNAHFWVDAASSELRAVGVVHDVEPSDLTAQQLAVARLAAQGMTNREIASRLMLSPRTVGTHLYRIFPKLGITSRRQLATVVEEWPRPRRGDEAEVQSFRLTSRRESCP